MATRLDSVNRTYLYSDLFAFFKLLMQSKKIRGQTFSTSSGYTNKDKNSSVEQLQFICLSAMLVVGVCGEVES